VEDPYAESAEFAGHIAKATAIGVVHGMRALKDASEGGGSSGGEPMDKLKKDLVHVVKTVEAAAAAAAHAQKLSIAAAQAFRKEEVQLQTWKKKLDGILASM